MPPQKQITILISLMSQHFQNTRWHNTQQMCTSKIFQSARYKYTYCFAVFDAVSRTWFVFGEWFGSGWSPYGQRTSNRWRCAAWMQAVNSNQRISTFFTSVRSVKVCPLSRFEADVIAVCRSVYLTILFTTCFMQQRTSRKTSVFQCLSKWQQWSEWAIIHRK